MTVVSVDVKLSFSVLPFFLFRSRMTFRLEQARDIPSKQLSVNKKKLSEICVYGRS